MPNDQPTPKDSAFPTETEIRAAVEFYVERECNNEWPEDEWTALSEHWDMNIWLREGKRTATVYLNTLGSIQVDAGISFHFE